jgi:hypothetical protein
MRVVGNVKSLPLVEGDYQIGLYINSGNVSKDYFDLLTLTIVSPARAGEVVPYPARDRGLVELDSDFSVPSAEIVSRLL